MMTLVIGLFFTLCRFTLGFDNGHYDGSLDDEFRLLLLGKTGHGKSSLGNHLLGREAFKSSPSPNSETRSGKKVTGKIGDKRIIVVDTPGVSDTMKSTSQTVDLIAQAVAFSPQGYDGFLVVLNPNVRITPEEKHAIKLLQTLFGDKFFDYVIFVFTHKNAFEERTRGSDYTFHKYLSELDDEMQTFLDEAEERVVFLDTKEKNTLMKTRTNMIFLEHLEDIRSSNGGERYSNSLFDTVAKLSWDYDNGRHQRSRFNENEEDGKGFFRHMYEKAKTLICAFLYFTPFAC